MEKTCESTLFLRHPASSMILFLNSSCSTAEELADMISEHSQYFNDEIKYALPFSRNEDLKTKFYRAIKIVNLRKIEDFVKAIQAGASEEYLANLSYLDKCSLSTQMLLLGEELSTIGIQSEEEKKQCFNVINEAIKKDFEEEAKKYGLTTDNLRNFFSPHQVEKLSAPLSKVRNEPSEKPVEKVKK